MTLQTSVNTRLGVGIPGEFYDYSPHRVAPYNLYTATADAVTATGKVAFGSTNASNNDTVSIAGQTYTFKTSLTAATTANEVLIGTDAEASAANLAAAINKGTGGGTKYGSSTVKNAWASAAVDATTSTTINLTALISGAAGNNIALSASVATATAFSGGVDAVVAPAYVGYAFSIDPSDPSKAKAGNSNSGTFGGILVSPKEYANYNNLNPTLAIQDGIVGQLCTFGEIFVQTAHTAKPGYIGCFRASDGKIGAATASNAIPAGYVQIPNATYQYVDASADGIAVLRLGD